MRILLTIFSLILSSSVFADTANIWSTMPDSICNIDKNDVISYSDSTDVLCIKVSSTLSMQAVSSNTKDSLIYVVKTYSAPAKESVLMVYDKQWNMLSSKDFALTDIVSKTAADKVATYYSPLLISAEIISPDDIKLSVADFMLSDDEKKEIKTILENQEEITSNKNGSENVDNVSGSNKNGSENDGKDSVSKKEANDTNAKDTLLSRTVAITTLLR